MAQPEIEIRHGQFSDLTGPPRRFGDITFVPAQIELFGTMFGLTHQLEGFLQRTEIAPDIKMLVRPGEDAVWLRGRAQQLFQIPDTTGEERGEKTLFLAAFLALVVDDNGQHFGVPFQCSDHYGRSGLTFSSEDSPPAELQDRIADAFWELVLSDPNDIKDYRDSILHPGAGIWLDFGVEDGEPFLNERM